MNVLINIVYVVYMEESPRNICAILSDISDICKAIFAYVHSFSSMTFQTKMNVWTHHVMTMHLVTIPSVTTPASVM